MGGVIPGQDAFTQAIEYLLMQGYPARVGVRGRYSSELVRIGG
jgi:hypothetical protein